MKHPVSELAVPNETVTTHWDLVATAPVSDAISFFPLPFAFFWMKLTWFHVVFAGNAVVVLKNHFLLSLREVTGVEGNTYLEIVLVGILESLSVCALRCNECKAKDYSLHCWVKFHRCFLSKDPPPSPSHKGRGVVSFHCYGWIALLIVILLIIIFQMFPPIAIDGIYSPPFMGGVWGRVFLFNYLLSI